MIECVHPEAKAEWTSQGVIAALVEAYAVLSETTARVGPRGLKAYWPEYQSELADLAAQAEIKSPDYARQRCRRSAKDVQRMEMALLGWTSEGVHHPAWLNGNLLAYERPRLCLIAHIIAKRSGLTETELCRRLRFSLATFKRQKMAAAQMIADRLNRLGRYPHCQLLLDGDKRGRQPLIPYEQ